MTSNFALALYEKVRSDDNQWNVFVVVCLFYDSLGQSAKC